MRPRPTHLLALAVAVAAALLPPGVAAAQQQVDNQVGRVDNRVGGELYGNENSTGRYPVGQYRLLPSEERNAIRRSGMLPSELRLNRAAYGPLPPAGQLNYVTPQSPLQRAYNLPEPQLTNPTYDALRGVQPGQRIENWAEPIPGGYPQNLRAGWSASGRVPGANLANRPTVSRLDVGAQLQQQSQSNGAPLPPIQLGPVEVEEPTRGTAVPRPLPQQPPSTAPAPSNEAVRPYQPLVPSLTGAPDRPLPTGEPPLATPAAALLSRSPAQQ